MEVAFAQARDLSEVTSYTETCPEKDIKKGQVHTKLSKTEVEASDNELEDLSRY